MRLAAFVASLAFIPAPPVVHFAHTRAPGLPQDWLSSAAYDSATKTVYFEGALSKSGRGHELGHAFDFQVLTDGDRVFFTRLMGLSGAWDQGSGYTRTAAAGKSPVEVFADWYGNAVNGHDATHSWDSSYSATPTGRTFRRFKQALARLGLRRHLKPYT